MAEDFKCAFTSAEGWGSFAQKAKDGGLEARISLHHGRLKLKTMALETGAGTPVKALLDSKPLQADLVRSGKRVLVRFAEPVEIGAGQKLEIVLG